MIPLPFTTLLIQSAAPEALRKDVRDPVMLWEAAPGTALHLGDEGPTKAGVAGLGPTVEDPLVFLFTRELTKFAQFLILAVAVAIVFYTPGLVETVAKGITHALGVH